MQGNTPEESDKLNILVTHGPIVSKIFTKSLNGSTSTEPEEGFILAISAEMSSRHTGLKEDQTCKGGSMWSGLHKEGGGISSFMSLILSMKKVRKSLLSALQWTGAVEVAGDTIELIVSNNTLGFLLFDAISVAK